MRSSCKKIAGMQVISKSKEGAETVHVYYNRLFKLEGITRVADTPVHKALLAAKQQ